MARVHLSLLAALSAVAACVAPNDGLEEKTSEVFHGDPFTDDVGYAYLTVGCSGTFLSPQWVLTAGHCFRDGLSAFPTSYDSTNVLLGNSTTNPQTSSEIFIHPNWWHPTPDGSTPRGPSATFWNSSYDVALVRLPTPFTPTTAQATSGLYSTLSNRYIGTDEQFICAGYGNTGSNHTGGGGGDLRRALLDVDTIAPIHTIPVFSSSEMIKVVRISDKALYSGDSGGGCYTQSPFSDRFVITGITSMTDGVVAVNGVVPDPTYAWLVYPWYVSDWVDRIMHNPDSASALPTGGIPQGAIFTSAATKATFTQGEFTIAASPSGPAAVLGPGDSSFISLPLTNLPAGGASPIGAAANRPLFAGSATLYLARVASDGKLWRAATLNDQPHWTLGSSGWTSLGAPAGVQFSTADAPAIGLITGGFNDRVDYFVRDSSGQMWTRTIAGGNMSAWLQIAAGTTFQSGPSVALAWGNQYNLIAVSTDGSPWMTSLSGVTATSTGTAWGAWSSLGGFFLSKVGIAGWDRGLRVYGIGGDHALYEATWDNDRANSGWFYLGGNFTGSMVQGVSASGFNPREHRVSLVLTNSSGAPAKIRFPR